MLAALVDDEPVQTGGQDLAAALAKAGIRFGLQVSRQFFERGARTGKADHLEELDLGHVQRVAQRAEDVVIGHGPRGLVQAS